MNYLVLPDRPTFIMVLAYAVLMTFTLISIMLLSVNFLNWSMSAECFRFHIFTILCHICYYVVHKCKGFS